MKTDGRLRTLTARRRGGQAMVELALVLPVFILLFAGMLECGLFFNAYLNVSFAAKEGARIAALDTNTTDQTVEAVVKGFLPSTATPTVSVLPAAPRVTGAAVTVTVSLPHTFVTPVIAAAFPANPYTITATTTMRSE